MTKRCRPPGSHLRCFDGAVGEVRFGLGFRVQGLGCCLCGILRIRCLYLYPSLYLLWPDSWYRHLELRRPDCWADAATKEDSDCVEGFRVKIQRSNLIFVGIEAPICNCNERRSVMKTNHQTKLSSITVNYLQPDPKLPTTLNPCDLTPNPKP